MKCNIILQSHTKCVITNLRSEHVKLLYNKFGFKVENAYFHPKYKLGLWDGIIRFFKQNGSTYVNLLDEIIPVIIKLGYKINLIDKRKDNSFVLCESITKDYFSEFNIELRDYQVAAVNAALNNNGGIIQAATGAGKTIITAAIAKRYEETNNLRSLIIVPDKTLTKQTTDKFRELGLDVGMFYSHAKETDRKHLITTWQSLNNYRHLTKDFDVVIVDECHGIRGNILRDIILENCQDIKYRFGVTGTVPKSVADWYALKAAVGNIVYEISAIDLIKQGFLANPHITIIQHSFDFTDEYNLFLEETEEQNITYRQFKENYFPDWQAEKKFLVSNEQRFLWIAKLLSEMKSSPQGNTLCLVPTIKFGRALAEAVNGYFINHEVSVKERKEIFDLFKDNNDIILIGTPKIAGTGLDIPRVFNLVLVDIGKSFIRTIQSIGRGLRVAEDKEYVDVFDITSDLKYSKRQLRERVKFYKEAKYNFTKQTVKIVVKPKK